MKASRIGFPVSIGDRCRDRWTGFQGVVTALEVDQGGNCYAHLSFQTDAGAMLTYPVACANLEEQQ